MPPDIGSMPAGDQAERDREGSRIEPAAIFEKPASGEVGSQFGLQLVDPRIIQLLDADAARRCRLGFRPGRGSLGFGLAHLGARGDRWHQVAQELVALTTLDAVVAALGLARVDFIKADVEGWELRLLHGGADSLRRFRPRLMLEFAAEHLARAGDRLDDAFAFLEELGYAAFELTSGGGLVPVTAPRNGDFWFFPREEPAA